MKKLITLSLPLASLTVALSAPVSAVEECYQDVCSTIEATNSCAGPGEATTISVEGVLDGASGFAVTAYRLYADAEWSYNSNHMVELTGGTKIADNGFHWGGSYQQDLEVTGGQAQKYTFVFGERRFGHTYYDVAVDLPMGVGGDSGQPLQIDIKPGSCPNPLNMNQKGITPVAIVGTGDLDIRSLDPYQIRLEGVAPVKYSYEDVATAIPMKATAYDCTTSLADGQEDLSLKFITQDLVEAIKAQRGGKMPIDGEMIPLTLTIGDDTGDSSCGGGYSGQDMIQALVKGKKK